MSSDLRQWKPPPSSITNRVGQRLAIPQVLRLNAPDSPSGSAGAGPHRLFSEAWCGKLDMDVKEFAQKLLHFVGFLGILIITCSLIAGPLVLGHKLERILDHAVVISFLAILLFGTPLAFSKSRRHWTGFALFAWDCLLSLDLWVTCFLITLHFWGLSGVIFGLICGGIGIVPVAFFASLVHGAWDGVIGIPLVAGLIFAVRWAGAWLISKSRTSPE